MTDRDPTQFQTAANILVGYASGAREFRGLELDEPLHDFSECTLAGSDFSGSFIVACFRRANLTGVNFSRCNLKTCDFSDANLSDANFEGAAIDGATFAGARLIGTTFLGATGQGHVYRTGEIPVSTK